MTFDINSTSDITTAMMTDDHKVRMVLRAAFRRSLYLTTKILIGYNKNPNLFTPEAYLERSQYIQWILFEKKRGLIEDPRSFVKSTGTSVAGPPFIAIQLPDEEYDHPREAARARKFLEDHPHVKGPDARCIIASDSKERAAKFVDLSRVHWVTNPLLRWCFPELLWENTNRTSYGSWSQNSYSTKGRLDPTQADDFVRAVGLDSKEQGGRADFIFVDDLVGETSWRSPGEIGRRRDFLKTITALLENSDYHNPRGGAVLLIENRWTLDDVNSMVHNDYHDWAIWRRGFFACATHGRGNCGRWGSDEALACAPTKDSTWPAQYPDAARAYASIEHDKGAEVAAAQYLNDPTRTAVFDVSLMTPFTLEPRTTRDDEGKEHRELHCILRPPEKPIEEVALTDLSDHCISVDPATSKEPLAARTAISWLAIHYPTSRVFWLECLADRWGSDESVEQLYALWKHVVSILKRPPKVLIEKVAAQTYMTSAFRLRARLDAVRLPDPIEVKPQHGYSKDDRIERTFGWRLNQGLICIREGLNLPKTEARHHPTGSKDALDTEAQAEVEVFLKYRTGANSDALRAARRRLKRARLAARGVTGVPV